ncbi:MAG: spore cortex biosynthesis protein YabQ [Caulobacteraceae bacterium]
METIQFQSFVFSYSVYGGILIGIIYDIYRVLRGRKKGERLITSLWDILFIFSVFIVVVWAIFSSNYGDIRAYVLIGFIVGFFLYERLLGRLAVGVFQFVMGKLVRFIKTTNSIIILPLKLIYTMVNRGLLGLTNFLGRKKNRLRKVGRLPKHIMNDTKRYYQLVIKRTPKK